MYCLHYLPLVTILNNSNVVCSGYIYSQIDQIVKIDQNCQIQKIFSFVELSYINIRNLRTIKKKLKIPLIKMISRNHSFISALNCT